MQLTNRDRKLSLSSNEEPEYEKPPTHNPLGDIYKQIARYPGRVVKPETAYGRIQRNPDMSLEEACLTPPKLKRSSKIPQMYSAKMLHSKAPDRYIEHLRSDKANSHVARIWELTAAAVKRHRILLNEEQQS